MELDELIRPRDTQASVIISLVAKDFGVTVNEILSERQTRRLVTPRTAAMWLLSQLTELSLPRIGRALGRRDHTTVIAALRRVERMRENDPDTAEKIKRLVEPARLALMDLQRSREAEAILSTSLPYIKFGMETLMQTFAIRIHALAKRNPEALAQIIAETTVKLGDAL